MSKYSESSTEFVDGALLIAALVAMGFSPENCIGNPKHLVGYLGDTRKEVADIIIPRAQINSSANDVGFIKRADGKFYPIISEYDSRQFDAKWLTNLKVKVGEVGIEQKAKKLGLRLAGKKIVNGKIKYQYLMA